VTGWLLDTNMLSAFGPGKRPLAAETVGWFQARADALHLSTITVAEIESGIAKLRRTGSEHRAENLRVWFDRILETYGERVLAFDIDAARIAGILDDAARAAGRHPGFPDVAIASIAKMHEFVVLTVNLRHFQPLGVDAVNPFSLN